jgi:acyl-CoA dehydrogenase
MEARIRDVLDAICARRPMVQAGNEWGSGEEEIVGSALRINPHEDGEVQEARAFQAALFDAGLAWVRGPKHFGGAGLGDEAIATLRRVAAEYVTPDLHCLHVGQQIVAPAIEAFGSEAQKRRWLPAIWRGDAIACQLFSEPDAGSDLASLTTQAARDGDTWRVTGQKVWSSGAHFSHLGELLARTDGDPASRHRGLTMFLIDMDQQGVTVRPLRQMNGSAHFCEVFLDDVVVSDDRRLGDVGQGWIVAQTSLTSERGGFGDEGGQLFDNLPRRLIELVRQLDGTDDPIRRNQLADVYSGEVIARLFAERMQHAQGSVAAASASMVKLFATDLDWHAAQIAASVLGASITADDGEWGRYVWSRVVLGVPAPRIAGGTDQIQKNIVAERALGLPREPR